VIHFAFYLFSIIIKLKTVAIMRFFPLLLAGSALLLPQISAHDVSARRAWAHYRRQVEAGTATQADLPRISPVSGATITKSIQQQIKVSRRVRRSTSHC